VDGENEGSEKGGTNTEERKGAEDAEGPDAEWNRRMKEKLERMKQKKMRDISITVTQKAGLSGALSSRQRRRYGDEEKVSGQGRVREELSKRQGTIEFLTGEDDGTVDICVQSIVANRNSPSRIALNVTMVADDEDEDEEEAEGTKSKAIDHQAAKAEMSRLERDLQALNNRARVVLSNADFNNEQQGAFIDQSVSMHSAATYWPIIQVLIIIVTGITQANHIIRYMRTHHIGI
jgi:emp24/gp25L/p24 family/GOLD